MGTSPRHSRGSFAVMGIRLLLTLVLACVGAGRLTAQCILGTTGGPCPPTSPGVGATVSNFTGSAPFTLSFFNSQFFPYPVLGLGIDTCFINSATCLFVIGPGHLTVSFIANGMSGFTVDIGGILQPPGRIDVSVTTPNSLATCSFIVFPPTSCVISNFPGGLVTINIDAFGGPPGGGAGTSEGDVAVSFTFGTAGATPLSITTSQLPAGVAGQAYSVPLTATGGQPPYTWNVVNVGSPPVSPLHASHLTLDPSSGLITGPRIYGGSNKFTVTVTDSAGATAQKTLTISTPCGFTKGDYPFVRLAGYAQYQATASSTLIVPYTFGYLPNPNPVGYNRCKTSISGCTLTIAAGMLATITGGDPIAATATPIWLDSQFVNQNPTGYGTGKLSNSYGPQLAGQPDWCEFDAGTWSFALPLSDQFNIALDPLSGPPLGFVLTRRGRPA